MIHTYTYKNLTWIDAESPTEGEIVGLVKRYGINALVGEDILSEYSRPRVERYADYIYMVLRIPMRYQSQLAGKNGRGKNHGKPLQKFFVKDTEIDFVIGRDFIVSSHSGPVEPIHNFAKILEMDAIVSAKDTKNKTHGTDGADGASEHAGYIFYYIIKKMYAHMEDDLEDLRASLMGAEAAIFDGNEKHMVRVLSNISRELIDLNQSSHIHKDVIEAFGPAALGFFGQDFKYHYVDDIIRQYAKLHQLISSNRELLADLRETNDSLLSTKQNEIMQTLTVIASIIFPLELVTGIFSMNTAYTPIVGSTHDFGIIMAILAALGLAMIGYFKYKRWV